MRKRRKRRSLLILWEVDEEAAEEEKSVLILWEGEEEAAERPLFLI